MSFSALPPELQRECLSYLPSTSLLTFSLTSHASYALALSALTTLHIGIYHTRVSALISSMSLSEISSTHPQSAHIPLLLPKRETKDKHTIIRRQNVRIAAILSTYLASLRDLELSIWDLEQPLAALLGRMQNLKHLSLRLDHPHTRHARLERHFWSSAAPSTVWNELATRADGTKVFGRLESLNLERSGITDFQLSRIIEQNPRLREIRLQKCLTLTEEFWEYLACSRVATSLERLAFTRSGAPGIDDGVLDYVGALKGLKVSPSPRILYAGPCGAKDAIVPESTSMP